MNYKWGNWKGNWDRGWKGLYWQVLRQWNFFKILNIGTNLGFPICNTELQIFNFAHENSSRGRGEKGGKYITMGLDPMGVLY